MTDPIKLILEKLCNIEADISTMKSDVSTMQSDITTMKSDITSLNSGQSENSKLLRALEHRTEENTAKLTSLEEKVNYIEGEIITIKKTQQLIKDDQLALSSRIDTNHAEVIEKLTDMDDYMGYVLSQLARHEAKLMAQKRFRR